MTDAAIQALEDDIFAFIGREIYPLTPAPDDVNEAMIRHWAEALGDTNPAYQDKDWAANSARGKTIAPPAMMYCWGQEGYAVTTSRPVNALSDLERAFRKHGYTGILGTNLSQEYFKEVGPGDNVQLVMHIDKISKRKTTARGPGYFFETVTEFFDQTGDKVGSQRFKVLSFLPNEPITATASDDKLEVPTRIASPRGHDNGWWWEACDEGKILIQRCKGCQTLRHPPRPMCGECQSMQWDSIESTLDGEVLSFTELHHPKIPGYQYPLLCAVIRLGEGTNIVSNVVGCDPSEVYIGMKVKGKVEQVDDKTMLPQFYPA